MLGLIQKKWIANVQSIQSLGQPEMCLHFVFIEQLFTGRAVAYDTVTKSPLIGAEFIIQTFKEMYFPVNARLDLAKVFSLAFQTREALLAFMGFSNRFLGNFITRLLIHRGIHIKIFSLRRSCHLMLGPYVFCLQTFTA
jgi:hypothetical protein